MRGRMTLEQHQQIVDLVAAGETLEAIAKRLGRSLNAVRNAFESRPAQKQQVQTGVVEEVTLDDLDEVVGFLSRLPDESLREVCELASLERQIRLLKDQILTRLRR